MRSFALAAAGILLLIFTVALGLRTRPLFRTPLDCAAVAFVVWVGITAAGSSFPAISRYETLRHAGGALLYLALAGGFSSRHLGRAWFTVTVAAALGCGVALVRMGNHGAGQPGGAFVDPQLLSAFAVLMLPATLAAAAFDERSGRRTAAMGAAVLVAAALLASRNRSAWSGAGVSLVALSVFAALSAGRMRLRLSRHRVLVPALTALVALCIVVGWSRQGGHLAQRLATVAFLDRDATLAWRGGMWRGALRMARERPAFGWGPGTFPIHQALFVDTPRSQRDILAAGASLSENAHNTYLQLAAETGIPGLTLFLAVPGLFLAAVVRALPRARGSRRMVLTGAGAAVSGFLVCAAGSPAWEFPECSTFLWAIIGLGSAAAMRDGANEHGRPRAGD